MAENAFISIGTASAIILTLVLIAMNIIKNIKTRKNIDSINDNNNSADNNGVSGDVSSSSSSNSADSTPLPAN